MTPTEKRILAAAKSWNYNRRHIRLCGCKDCTALDKLSEAVAANASAAKLQAARKRKPRKWKPETPSPYDLSDTWRGERRVRK